MKDLETELRGLASRPEAEEADPDTVERLVQGGIERGRRRSSRAGAAALAISAALLGTALVVQQSGILDPPATLADHADVPSELRGMDELVLDALRSVAPPGARIEEVDGASAYYGEVVQRFTWSTDAGLTSGEIIAARGSRVTCESLPVDTCEQDEHGARTSRAAADGRGGQQMVSELRLPDGTRLTVRQWNRSAGARTAVTTPGLPWTAQQARAALSSEDLRVRLAPLVHALDLVHEGEGSISRSTVMVPDQEQREAISTALLPARAARWEPLGAINGQAFQFTGDHEGRAGTLTVMCLALPPTSCSGISWGATACREVQTAKGRGIVVDDDLGGSEVRMAAVRLALFVHQGTQLPVRGTQTAVVTELLMGPEGAITTQPRTVVAALSPQEALSAVQSEALDPLVDAAAHD